MKPGAAIVVAYTLRLNGSSRVVYDRKAGQVSQSEEFKIMEQSNNNNMNNISET